MRKQRSDAHVTLDTQVIVNNRRESIFRHLEDSTLDFMLITNYNGKNGYKVYCAVIPGTCLHWRIAKESAERYLSRRSHIVCVDYNHWSIEQKGTNNHVQAY